MNSYILILFKTLMIHKEPIKNASYFLSLYFKFNTPIVDKTMGFGVK